MAGLLSGIILYAALGAQPSTAVATDPGSVDQSTVVVTGQRSGEKDMQAFVRALTPVAGGGQLSRFEKSVCPAAVGLAPHQRDAVAARMRRVAQAAGIRVAGPKCVPNVVLIVTQDKNALLHELRRTKSDYFESLSLRRIRDLSRQPGPAVAWQLAGPPVNARGVEYQIDPGLGVYASRTTDPSSRIEQPARPQFDAAVVIVERGSLDGLTVTQLGDYAAMRAFAGLNAAQLAKSATPTMLKVLEAPMGSEVAPSLTQWDLGFLRGLYAAPRNLRPGAQRSAIGRDIVKDVKRER